MFERLFLAHPRSVDESYFEHMGQAFGFGGRMVLAGLACLLHGLVPGLCVRSGSRAIAALHDRMVVNRNRKRGATAGAGRAGLAHAGADWVI